MAKDTPKTPPEKQFKIQIWGGGAKNQYVQASVWRGHDGLPPTIMVNKQFLWRGKYCHSVKFTPHQIVLLKKVVELAIAYCEEQGWYSEDYKKLAKEMHRRNMVKIGREIPLPDPNQKPDEEPLYDKSVEAFFRKDDWED